MKLQKTKVIDDFWFTPAGGTIGIVLMENEVGQKKAYIKCVTGFDRDEDIRAILDYGSPVTIQFAKAIFDHLKPTNEKENEGVFGGPGEGPNGGDASH
jgi:hypothetical protein